MSFFAIVPARLASTRLPRKALADIGGLPMVVRVAAQAREAGATRVMVATDAVEILEVCARHGVEALLTSPEHATGTDRLAEAVARLSLADDAIVVNVQGDEPLVPTALICACAELLAARDDCAIATAAHAIDSAAEFANPNVVKVVVDAADRALYFSRAPIPFPRERADNPHRALAEGLPALRHIGLYAYRAGFLRAFPTLAQPALERFESLEQLRALFHGYRIAVHRTPTAPPAGVDTAEDLERVRRILAASVASGRVL